MLTSLIGVLEQQLVNENLEKKFSSPSNGQILRIDNSAFSGARGVMFWFKALSEKNTSSGTQTLFQYQQGSPNTLIENGRVELFFRDLGTAEDGKLEYLQKRTSDGVSFRALSTRTIWKQDEWYHVCAHTHSTRGLELYINGVLVDSDAGLTEAWRNNLTDASFAKSVVNGIRDCDVEIKQIKVIEGDIDQSDVINELTNKPSGAESYIRAYWNFENYSGGTSDDITGTYTGTFTNPFGSTNALILDTPITDYYNLKFQSVNDEYVNLGNTLVNETRRFCFWFNPSVEINAGSGNFYNPLISRVNLDATRDNDFAVQFSNGRVVFEIRNGAGTPYLAYSAVQTFLAETWYHLTCQVDSVTGMKIYIDGVESGSGNSYSSAVGTEGNDLAIGAVLRDSRRFNGKIKGVKIFNDSGTPAEIISEMTSIPDGTDINLKAYLPMLQGEGDKTYDFKGNYEGTLNSTASIDDMWELAPD